MDVLGAVKNLLTGRKRFEKITVDQLRKERIRLEQIEQRVNKEVETLEKRKQDLFAKGKEEASQRQQVALARMIKEADSDARGKDRTLVMISRQKRVIAGLIAIKENEKVMKDLGVSSVVSKMDMEQLQKYVEKATVEGQFQMEKFANILKTVEGAGGMDVDIAEDDDTLAIVAAMQEAKAAEDGGGELSIDEGLKKVDAILKADEEKPEEV